MATTDKEDEKFSRTQHTEPRRFHDRRRVNINDEQVWVEAWLDENPDFFLDYLIRKASRTTIDTWIATHTLPGGTTNRTSTLQDLELGEEDPDTSGRLTVASESCLKKNDQSDGQSGVMSPRSIGAPVSGITLSASKSMSGSGSMGSSGSGTPVRKISAQEFEREGLTNKPLVNTTLDGTPTFLSPPTTSDVSGQIRKKSRNDVEGLNETELIFELVKDICNDLDIKSLCHKILQNVGILTCADRCSLFLVQGDPDNESRCLISNLFDVSSNSTVEEMSQKEGIRVPWGSGIVGHVAKSGTAVNISDCYQDDRFNQDIDSLTGYRTRSMMCHPIKKPGHSTIIGVAQVINKAGGPNSSFTAEDEDVFGKYLQFCGIGLHNAQLYERSQLEVRRNQVLLDLAGVIFQEQSTIDVMIERILAHMLSLIRCERAALLLVHEISRGTFSRVFDLDANELEELDNSDNNLGSKFVESGSSKRLKEGRFPINAGITGYVAATGETVNIADAYADSRFDPAVDENSGDFRHKTILCMPIMYNNKPNKVLGIFQLVNKFGDLPFTKNDENFVEAFAIFCGMGIRNVRMYEQTCLAMTKQQVLLEVLSYHATAPVDEAMKLARQKIPSAAALQLHSFSFDDFGLNDSETLQAALRMFIDLDFLGRFCIDYNVLCRWLVSIKKNYRAVSYHNWRHAFNVAQVMFSVITNTQWWTMLGEVECLSLIIACLCHDLDHRGTNNSYQVKASSSLAQLYSTSTMEHHHFDQCLMILNSKGNQILANLTQNEFKSVIGLLEDCILATDLAVYFRRRNETFEKMNKQTLQWTSNDHDRSLFRGLMMTACDLGAITKPWEIQKKVAKLVAEEFYEQGDMEKKEFHEQPLDMMNRDKIRSLPSMQVDFIDNICLPIYQSFASYSEQRLEPMLKGCLLNKSEWSALAELEVWDEEL